jgi:putative toxin-antitoxin system antitoxin component (TIGR02293 family)
MIDMNALEANDTARTYALLGGPAISKRTVQTSLDAHDMIIQGLPSAALFHLVDAVHALSSEDMLTKAIGISLRTLQRKKKTDPNQGRLSPEQSGRAWRFAEILAKATDVLGGQSAAEAWMLAPATGLDNRRPIDLLASVAGAEAVEHHLTRMEYGVYI